MIINHAAQVKVDISHLQDALCDSVVSDSVDQRIRGFCSEFTA